MTSPGNPTVPVSSTRQLLRDQQFAIVTLGIRTFNRGTAGASFEALRHAPTLGEAGDRSASQRQQRDLRGSDTLAEKRR